MELLYDPEIPLLRIYPNNPKTLIRKNICTLIYHSQDLETTNMPISIWVDKENLWYIYIIKYKVAMKQNYLICFPKAWVEL